MVFNVLKYGCVNGAKINNLAKCLVFYYTFRHLKRRLFTIYDFYRVLFL